MKNINTVLIRRVAGFLALSLLTVALGSTTMARESGGFMPLSNLTLAFSANKKEVEKGGSVILSWSTVNAETCTASGDWDGLKPAYGSQVVEDIQEPKTFTLTCENEAGMASMTVKVALIEEGSMCKQQFGNIFWCGQTEEEFIDECGESAISYSMGTACNASGGTVCGACVYEEEFPSNKCEETDGGARDFLTKGRVKGYPSAIHSSDSAQDWCVDSSTLREYYLKYESIEGVSRCSIYYHDKECECADGACVDKRPTLEFSSNASKVEQGGSVELQWDSENTMECLASGDWSGEKPVSGSETMTDLQADQTYELECTGENGSVRKVLSIEVTENPPVVALNASSNTIEKGGSVTLTWSSENTDSCVADGGWSGNRETSGNEKITEVQENTIFRLKCSGTAGSASAKVEVKVVDTTPTPKLVFFADQNQVDNGDDVTLTWEGENVDTCEATGDWEGEKEISGSQQITDITSDKVFNLTCRQADAAGQFSTLGAVITRTVRVVVTPDAVTMTISADKDTVYRDETLVISWTSTNTETCEASGGWEGERPVEGSESISNLTEDTTFALRCTGPGGSIEDEVFVYVLAPPPSLAFSADKTKISAGESVVLSWSTVYADYGCAATGGWSGEREPEGSEEITGLTEDTTFQLECAGQGGNVTESVTVEVTPVPPTLEFFAEPEAVVSGESSILTWAATGAETCTASGDWEGEKATEGTQTIENIIENQEFTLSCSGDGGSVTKSVTVSVVEITPTLTFMADPVAVSTGESSTLSWISTNTDSCQASGDWEGEKATEGTQTIENITADMSFTLTCSKATGPGQGSSAKTSIARTVRVLVDPQGMELHFTSNKDEVVVGESVTLQWVSENTETCEASGGWEGEKNTSGTEVIESLTEDSTFTLTCSADGQTISETITVTVTEPEPELTLTANANSVEKGDSVTLSWESENTEACLASGDWEGEKDLSGEEVIEDIQKDSEFILTCSGPGGEAEARVEVALNEAFVALGAEPMEVKKGDPVTLEWQTENVTECEASGGWGGSKDADGGSEMIPSVTQDTEFVIECSDGASTASDSVRVTVISKPIEPNPVPQICHLIQSGQEDTPENFAHPWNVFSSAKELIIQVFCQEEMISVELGNNEPNLYIWHEAYVTKNGGDWIKTSVVGQQRAEDNDKWLVGSAHFVEQLNEQQLSIINYIASYQCVYIQGSWKCGCRDRSSCTESGLWSLQMFTKPEGRGLPEDPPEPSPVPDDDDVPGDPDDPGPVPDDDDDDNDDDDTGNDDDDDDNDDTGNDDDDDDNDDDTGNNDDDDNDDNTETPLAAYCGDGVVNQDWEQCDVKNDGLLPDDTCTDHCQLIEQDSCRDLTLARVTIQDVKNWHGGDVEEFIFLGSSQSKIPAGAWFALAQNGDPLTDPDIQSYEDVPGLAVQRQDGSVRVVLYGSHPSADATTASAEALTYDIEPLDSSSEQAKEHASGYVDIWNASITGLRSDNTGNNKLEGEDFTDGSGKGKYNAGDDEIWLGENDPQSRANFWLTVTTADDGFHVDHDSTPTCIDYIAYCGDGEVNQPWEQCDEGSGGPSSDCNDKCQRSDDSFCVDLSLARVVPTEVKNWYGGDVTTDVFLGGATNKIPAGTWFVLSRNGDPLTDPDIQSYEDVPGLAVQRQDGSVRVVLYGSHPSADATTASAEALTYDIEPLDSSSGQAQEHASGYLETWNTTVTGLRSDDTGNNKLEGEDFTDGSGKGSYKAGDDEIWLDQPEGVTTKSHFWLTVTTADDGYHTDHEKQSVCSVDGTDPTKGEVE